MPSEDSQDAQLTGLSRSVTSLQSQADLCQAQKDCQAHLQSLKARGILPNADPSALAWLLQVQVPTVNLAIAIYDRTQHDWYLECYLPSQDPFSGEQTPFFQGSLNTSIPAQIHPDRLKHLLSQVLSVCPKDPGLEVEVVLDRQGQWHCVQAKSLRASPTAKHQHFLDAAQAQLAAQGRSLKDFARLELDAEHNPEPLSPAHIWLLSALSATQPAPSYVVLCGWLYAIEGPRQASAQLRPPDLPRTLRRLSDELLPDARTSLANWRTSWSKPCKTQICGAIDDAVARCQEILQYRRQWVDKVRAQGPRNPAREDFSYPSTLSGKADFADVLPTRWDISAPSLQLASLPQDPAPASPHPTALPEDQATRWALLDEWDDHLFALALELPRQAWLHAANVLKIPSELIFFVGKADLTAHARGELDASELLRHCQQGKAQYQRQAQLHAPSLLLAGRPALQKSASRWQGIGLGPSMHAQIYKRQDLQALLADPPPPGSSLLAIPALTAPAALALHRLKIRAVVTQYGGASSHGARMAAELGLSAIIGCEACMELPEGNPVWLDTRTGRLWRVDDPP